MKLNRKFRLAAGTAAITFSAALAMPGIAYAGGSHHDDGDDHAASAEHRGDVSDHHGDDADHHRGDAADHRGDAPCPDKSAPKEEAKPAAPAAKTTSYPTQSKTGSIAVSNTSSESGIVLVTLAAATALGGVAVRRATSR